MRFVTLSLVALGLMTAKGAAAADVIVQANVTPLGSQFRYDYTLTNVSAADNLILLSLTRPGPSSITDISAPSGWDSSNLDAAYVDFIAQGSGLAPGSGPLAGFGYTSAVRNPVDFQAFDASGNLYEGSVIGASAIPEPGTFVLLGFAALALVACSRRRLGYPAASSIERG